MSTQDPMTLARARVAKGVKLLNRKVPGWRKKIKVKKLRMEDCWQCILGQLFGYAGDGGDALKIKGWHEYGFDSDFIKKVNFKMLQSAWLEVLTKQPA